MCPVHVNSQHSSGNNAECRLKVFSSKRDIQNQWKALSCRAESLENQVIEYKSRLSKNGLLDAYVSCGKDDDHQAVRENGV